MTGADDREEVELHQQDTDLVGDIEQGRLVAEDGQLARPICRQVVNVWVTVPELDSL